jgi:hypothetical protein
MVSPAHRAVLLAELQHGNVQPFKEDRANITQRLQAAAEEQRLMLSDAKKDKI